MNLIKQSAGNVSTCDLSNDHPPTNNDESNNAMVTQSDKLDEEGLAYEQSEMEDVFTPSEKESNGHSCEVQCQSRPVIERLSSDGSVAIETQVDITAQKLTVLKINQLLRKTRKLLATNQDIVEEPMETSLNSNKQGSEVTHDN